MFIEKELKRSLTCPVLSGYRKEILFKSGSVFSVEGKEFSFDEFGLYAAGPAGKEYRFMYNAVSYSIDSGRRKILVLSESEAGNNRILNLYDPGSTVFRELDRGELGAACFADESHVVYIKDKRIMFYNQSYRSATASEIKTDKIRTAGVLKAGIDDFRVSADERYILYESKENGYRFELLSSRNVNSNGKLAR